MIRIDKSMPTIIPKRNHIAPMDHFLRALDEGDNQRLLEEERILSLRPRLPILRKSQTAAKIIRNAIGTAQRGWSFRMQSIPATQPNIPETQYFLELMHGLLRWGNAA